MAHALQGATLVIAPTIEIAWAPVAPQIAGSPASYTEAQLATFLQTCVQSDGSRARPPMPLERRGRARGGRVHIHSAAR